MTQNLRYLEINKLYLSFSTFIEFMVFPFANRSQWKNTETFKCIVLHACIPLSKLIAMVQSAAETSEHPTPVQITLSWLFVCFRFDLFPLKPFITPSHPITVVLSAQRLIFRKKCTDGLHLSLKEGSCLLRLLLNCCLFYHLFRNNLTDFLLTLTVLGIPHFILITFKCLGYF